MLSMTSEVRIPRAISDDNRFLRFASSVIKDIFMTLQALASNSLIIPFFRLFFKDEKCRQKHAEFISEFCVFLFALSIGRFRWILENILMRKKLIRRFFVTRK